MVGERLRQEREQRNLTIHDIAVGTSIREVYIQAIENGEYDALPGEVYTKGFIRNYAAFMGLEAGEFVAAFSAEHAPKAAVSEPVQEAAKPTAKKAPASAAAGSAEGLGSSSGLKVAAVAAAVVLALAGGYAFMSRSDSFMSGTAAGNSAESTTEPAGKAEIVTTTTPAPPTPAPPSTVTPAPAAPAAPSQQIAQNAATQPQPASPAAPATPPSNVEVSAKFTDSCWTKVVADGQTIYEGILENGQTMSWKGNEKIIVTAGNAGAVEFTHNGKNDGKAGHAGEVVDKVFTRDKVN